MGLQCERNESKLHFRQKHLLVFILHLQALVEDRSLEPATGFVMVALGMYFPTSEISLAECTYLTYNIVRIVQLFCMRKAISYNLHSGEAFFFLWGGAGDLG